MTYKIIPYVITLLIWALFVGIMFTTQDTESAKQLHIDPSVRFAIQASVAVIYLLIWMAGVFAWTHVRQYARSMKSAPEAVFSTIAHGVLALIGSFVAANIVGSVRAYFITNPDVVIPATIVANYVYTLLPLVGFLFLYIGTRKLAHLVPENARPTLHYVLGLLFVFVMSIVYLAITFTNPNRQIPSAYDIPASFYLPDVLIVLTIVIPAVIGWILGVFAVINMRIYKKNVTGENYKNGLTKFIYGFVCLIGVSIVLQVLLSLGQARLLGMSLGALIAIIYFLIILLPLVGYGFIALGARRLGKAEEP